MIVPIHDLASGRTRELAVIVHPPLSHTLDVGEERTLLLVDVLDPSFRLEMTDRDAGHLSLLIEMGLEKLP